MPPAEVGAFRRSFVEDWRDQAAAALAAETLLAVDGPRLPAGLASLALLHNESWQSLRSVKVGPLWQQELPVLLVQAQLVDAFKFQRLARDGERDPAVRFDRCVVADPAQQAIRHARRAPAAG